MLVFISSLFARLLTQYPGLHQSNLIADLMSGTYGHIELDTNIIPQRSRVEFLRGALMLTELNQWAIGRVGPYNFMSKWHVGRARPEVSCYQDTNVNFDSIFGMF